MSDLSDFDDALLRDLIDSGGSREFEEEAFDREIFGESETGRGRRRTRPRRSRGGDTAGGGSSRQSAGSGVSPLLQSPTRKNIRVVVKSFISRIGNRVGVPRCTPAALPRLAALAMATDASFSENPRDDLKRGNYRLYSGRTFDVACLNGRMVVRGTALETDAGQECAPFGHRICFQPPPLITSNVRAAMRGPTSFEFSWTAKGKPHPNVEPSFQAVCPRSSVYIWHTVTGRIDCDASGIRIQGRVVGSRFPTHRIFINGAIQGRDVQQGEFFNLWIPHRADRTMVQ